MQHILSLVRRCVEDYHMIESGDTVAVGVSGGKDSVLTLAALARLRSFSLYRSMGGYTCIRSLYIAAIPSELGSTWNSSVPAICPGV